MFRVLCSQLKPVTVKFFSLLLIFQMNKFLHIASLASFLVTMKCVHTANLFLFWKCDVVKLLDHHYILFVCFFLCMQYWVIDILSNRDDVFKPLLANQCCVWWLNSSVSQWMIKPLSWITFRWVGLSELHSQFPVFPYDKTVVQFEWRRVLNERFSFVVWPNQYSLLLCDLCQSICIARVIVLMEKTEL